MKTIVALVDLTDASSKVLNHARTLASAFGSEVILLHVVPHEPVTAVSYGNEMPPIPIEPSPDLIQADKVKLDGLLSSLLRVGVRAKALQFQGPVAETVLEETARLHADLVIMGSHHHGMLYNLFVGSVAADVLRHIEFPVLVIPCDTPKEESRAAAERSFPGSFLRASDSHGALLTR